MRVHQLLAKSVPALVVLSLVSCGRTPVDVVPGVSLELARYRAATIADIHYRLHLSIPERRDADIPGDMTVTFLLNDNDDALQLDFRESAEKLLSVTTNGTASAYEFTDEHLLIPKTELHTGSNKLEIKFVAGDTSLNRNADYLYTLFVPDRARTAFPLFDQPDLKATYELTLDIPAAWTAMSNAAIDSVKEHDGVKTLRFHKTDLISSYLFAFVAGEFQQVTREVGGRTMTMLHRETDAGKVARNIDSIFNLHAGALDWLEEYTGIDYPFQKFGFALIPDFQYGGMEHVGAIQYRASSLMLDEAPSENELLGRAGLISHETAHMWFGDLVTMQWFDDVWTKEVFANFMAAKIVNPGFPDINHELNFLVRHYPSAYSVDRTPGANPIRQPLANLNEAGQMYGAIIYEKAPVMMRQLEMLIGADIFREGMRDYLQSFAFANATWPALIDILDRKSKEDLKAWSEVWVNTAGRPGFELRRSADEGDYILAQDDPDGAGRIWPQRFSMLALSQSGARSLEIVSIAADTPLADTRTEPVADLILDADGRGYGLFPADIASLEEWARLDDVAKAALLINLYEQLLTGAAPAPLDYFEHLAAVVIREKNQLVLELALGQLRRLYWMFLTDAARDDAAGLLGEILWTAMLDQDDDSMRKIYFDAFADIALEPYHVQRVYDVWSGELAVDKLPLGENDRIDIAETLAVKLPAAADDIIAMQIAKTSNPDNVRKLEFIRPSVSADQTIRDNFFFSLAEERNRQTESWVLEALQNLHHPLRRAESERYVLPSLELLQEIQVTGDIFFPKRWLDATLGNYRSTSAAHIVTGFLENRPDYNRQLRMKILQAADPLYRANRILGADRERGQ